MNAEAEAELLRFVEVASKKIEFNKNKFRLIKKFRIPLFGPHDFIKEKSEFLNETFYKKFKNKIIDFINDPDSNKNLLKNNSIMHFIINIIVLNELEKKIELIKDEYNTAYSQLDNFLFSETGSRIEVKPDVFIIPSVYYSGEANLLKKCINLGFDIDLINAHGEDFKKELKNLHMTIVHELCHIFIIKDAAGLKNKTQIVKRITLSFLSISSLLSLLINPLLGIVSPFIAFALYSKTTSLSEGAATFLTTLYNYSRRIVNLEQNPKDYEKWSNKLIKKYSKFVAETGSENQPLRRFLLKELKLKQLDENVEEIKIALDTLFKE